MRRVLVGAAAAVAVVASLVPARFTAVGLPAFSWGSSIGGGVVDLTTGRQVEPAPESDSLADVSATVLPYRPGARYRIPLILTIEEGVRDLLVTDVRVLPGRGSVARAAGAVYEPDGCCALTDPEPFAPFRLGVRAPGRSFETSTAVVGVDVELCCTPPPPGWVELLPGFAVTYRRHGVTRTLQVPFPRLQQVVIRA